MRFIVFLGCKINCPSFKGFEKTLNLSNFNNMHVDFFVPQMITWLIFISLLLALFFDVQPYQLHTHTSIKYKFHILYPLMNPMVIKCFKTLLHFFRRILLKCICIFHASLFWNLSFVCMMMKVKSDRCRFGFYFF